MKLTTSCLLLVLQCGLLQAAIPRPGPPYLELSGTRSTNATLVLGPPNRGREKVDGYRIYYGPSANPRADDRTKYITATPARQSMFITISDLLPATNYTFRVAADARWTGTYVTIFAITRPKNKPSTVTITSSPISNARDSYTLTWQKNSQDSASNQVDHYDVIWGLADSSEPIDTMRVEDAELNPVNKSTVISDLQPETRYWVTVTAKNMLGEAPPSLPIVFTTMGQVDGMYSESRSIEEINDEEIEHELPGVVEGLRTVSTTPTKMVVQITAPESNGGSPILLYRLQYWDKGDRSDPGTIVDFPVEDADQETMTVTVENLVDYTTYTYRVKAVNAQGEGPPVVREGKTKIASVPGKVTITSPTKGRHTTTYTLTWIETETGGRDIRLYVIRHKEAGVDRYVEDTLRGAHHVNYTLDDLKPDTTYMVEVMAVNVVGRSEPSDEFSFKTSTELPGVVEGLRTVSTTPTKMVVQITAPESAGGSPILFYRLQYWDKGDRSDPGTIVDFPVKDADQETMTVTVENLVDYTTYIYRVKAVNAFGEGPPVVREGKTKIASVPGKVTITSPTRGRHSTIYTLTWIEPETGGRDIRLYVIRHKEVGADRYYDDALRGAHHVNFTIDDLKPDTTYMVEIMAVNIVGRSEPSDAFSFKTAKVRHDNLKVELTPADVTSMQRAEGDDLVLTCAARGLDDYVIPEIKWLHNGMEVNNRVHRLMTHSPTAMSKNLYIFKLAVADGGNYTCQVKAGVTVKQKSISLETYKDISVTAPLLQYQAEGSDALIECSVTGDPQPAVWWTHGWTYIPNGGRYSYEKDGLRIRGVTLADRGLYTCVGQVAEQGRVKERKIAFVVS